MTHRALSLLIPAVAVTAALTVPQAAQADSSDPSVAGWLRHNAVPITSTDLGAPSNDLAPLRRSVGDAVITGLGESSHGAAEELQLKSRVARMLVESEGYRTIAWEEDWTLGRRIDAFLQTGKGDLPTLMSRMSGQWQTREVAGFLQWLRAYNTAHERKVRFVGVEFYLTPPRAYSDVERYLARTAPDRLAEVQRHLEAIRPTKKNMYKYLGWYADVPNKATYTRHARKAYALVRQIARDPQIVRTAWQIKAFYEHYQLPVDEQPTYRDAHSAQNLRWWRDSTGDKIAYWAASPHTAVSPQLRIAVPPDPDLYFASAGSYLRRWYGQRYRSIGFTFDHGSVSGQTAPMPPPAPDWFERPLAQVPLEQFAIDLRRPAPQSVCRWLHADLRTRGLPGRGPDSVVSGGTLAQAFDVLVHRQEVSPAQPA